MTIRSHYNNLIARLFDMKITTLIPGSLQHEESSSRYEKHAKFSDKSFIKYGIIHNDMHLQVWCQLSGGRHVVVAMWWAHRRREEERMATRRKVAVDVRPAFIILSEQCSSLRLT